MKALPLLAVLPWLAVAGCATHSEPITAAPADWGQFAGKKVTIQGTAGNSPRGPIVRLNDGGYVALRERDPWGFADGLAIASRSVEVTGTVVSGAGVRIEPFVLDVMSVRLMGPDETRRTVVAPGAP